MTCFFKVLSNNAMNGFRTMNYSLLIAKQTEITENVTSTLQRDFLINVLSDMKFINCVVL